MSLADKFAPFEGLTLIPAFADVYPKIKIGGVPQEATWPDHVYAAVGEPIIVAQIIKGDAPAQNVVFARVGAPGPREATITAAPGGSDTITASVGGTDYTATFLTSYTPTVGDRVRLLWQGRDVTVIGKVGLSPGSTTELPSTAAPPPGKSADTFKCAASDSGTWTPELGIWDKWSYPKSVGMVYQGGSAYGGSNKGAWFYANAMAELAGATISKIQFLLPSRRTVGDSNSALNVNLWAHTASTKPGGDVTRTVGPTPFTVPPGWAGGWIDLPLSFASTLIAGGGVSISGEPYLGFVGKPSDPSSGQLRLDWSR